MISRRDASFIVFRTFLNHHGLPLCDLFLDLNGNPPVLNRGASRVRERAIFMTAMRALELQTRCLFFRLSAPQRKQKKQKAMCSTPLRRNDQKLPRRRASALASAFCCANPYFYAWIVPGWAGSITSSPGQSRDFGKTLRVMRNNAQQGIISHQAPALQNLVFHRKSAGVPRHLPSEPGNRTKKILLCSPIIGGRGAF